MAATATLKTRSIQGESLPAATDRLINSVLLSEGVVDKAGGSFEVLQNLGTDMNVKIGSTVAFDLAVIQGDLAGQGVFVAEHQNATQVLAVVASDPTNDRIDLVILRIFDDTFDSSGNDYSDLEVVTGTPSGSPVTPAVPSGSFVLAEILVQNAVTQIVNGDITDKRVEAMLLPRSLPMVRSRSEVTSLVDIGTTEGVHLTLTLTIPPDWNTWDIDLFCQFRMNENGAAGPAIINARIRRDNTSGAIVKLAVEEVSDAADDTDEVVAIVGFEAGRTATGVITYILGLQASAENLLYRSADRTIIAYAWRIT